MDNTTTCEPTPEPQPTKFGELSAAVETNTGIITSTFQSISDFENRIGEPNTFVNPECEIQESPISVIDKNTDQLKKNNEDLIQLNTRLTKLLDLF